MKIDIKKQIKDTFRDLPSFLAVSFFLPLSVTLLTTPYNDAHELKKLTDSHNGVEIKN